VGIDVEHSLHLHLPERFTCWC